jgi:hypothetical protein
LQGLPHSWPGGVGVHIQHRQQHIQDYFGYPLRKQHVQDYTGIPPYSWERSGSRSGSAMQHRQQHIQDYLGDRLGPGRYGVLVRKRERVVLVEVAGAGAGSDEQWHS